MLSDLLIARLSVGSDIDLQTVAWPSHLHGTEQAITDAIVAALRYDVHLDGRSALIVQRALLSRCPRRIRRFYWSRLLDVIPTPTGRLAPDFLLDGSRHSPPAAVATLLIVETKYRANWQCPRAEDLSREPAEFGYDGALIFGKTHDIKDGVRTPHRIGDRHDCGDYWHSHVGSGLYIASAVQLDVYIGFLRTILRSLGLDGLADADLRPHGLLIDARQRKVDDWLAVTSRHWSTTGFSALLFPVASRYESLRRVSPDAEITQRMGVLLGRLLYL